MNIDVLNQIVMISFKWFVLSLLVTVLVRRSRNSSAQLLSALLGLVLVCLLILPFVNWYGPVWLLPILPESIVALSKRPTMVNGEYTRSGILLLALASVWLMVAIFLIVRLLQHLARAYHLVQHSQPLAPAVLAILQALRCTLQIKRAVEVRCSNDTRTPFTIGSIYPVIILPSEYEQWPEARIRRFLLHELAHIKRHDWLKKILGQIIVAGLWFLPSAWWLHKKALWYAELACDDLVIRIDGQRHDYALDLLAMGEALTTAARGGVALIDGSTHYQRIDALLDSSRVREEQRRKYWLSALFLSVLLVLWASVQLGVRAPLPVTPKLTLIVAAVAPIQPPARLIRAVQLPETNLWLPPPLPPKAPPFSRQLVVNQLKMHDLNDIVERPLYHQAQPLLASPDFLIRTVSVTPDYPRAALRNRIEGWAKVQFTVLANGHTSNINVIERSPTTIFDRAVISAVEQFRYRPLAHNQKWQSPSVVETFQFQMIEDANHKAD